MSTSIKVRQFILQKLIIPFVRDLRNGDPYINNSSNNETILDRTQVVLKLDSDIPFLSLLKRTEIVLQLNQLKINIGKIGGGFTEYGSACDRSRYFANTKHN